MTAAEGHGKVTAGNNASAGGVAGANLGTIVGGIGTGEVTGGSRSNVGGVVGDNRGTVSYSHANGSVRGGTYAALGGLAGVNRSVIDYSTAATRVNYQPAGYQQVYGGLAGLNTGRMTGNVAYGAASCYRRRVRTPACCNNGPGWPGSPPCRAARPASDTVVPPRQNKQSSSEYPMTRNSPAWTQRPRRRRAAPSRGLQTSPPPAAGFRRGGQLQRCDEMQRSLPPSGDGGWSGTGLTAAAKPGDVLLKRTVSFFVRFETKRTQSPRVLAALGNWINPVQLVNTDIMPVVLANDPTPFVSKIGIRMSHKDQAIYRGPQQQTILNVKELATEDTNYAFDLFRELVLLVDPKELPAGDIKITGIAKVPWWNCSPTRWMRARHRRPDRRAPCGGQRLQQQPRHGQADECPDPARDDPQPMQSRSHDHSRDDEELFAPQRGGTRLGRPGSDPFTLKLSDCAQNAKPQIWFRDENEPGNTSDTLSVSGGAGGIGIAMFSLPTGKPARRVKYFSSAPPAGSSGHHAMEVNGTEATLKFFARYVRTGEPLAAGMPTASPATSSPFPNPLRRSKRTRAALHQSQAGGKHGHRARRWRAFATTQTARRRCRSGMPFEGRSALVSLLAKVREERETT